MTQFLFCSSSVRGGSTLGGKYNILLFDSLHGEINFSPQKNRAVTFLKKMVLFFEYIFPFFSSLLPSERIRILPKILSFASS